MLMNIKLSTKLNEETLYSIFELDYLTPRERYIVALRMRILLNETNCMSMYQALSLIALVIVIIVAIRTPFTGIFPCDSPRREIIESSPRTFLRATVSLFLHFRFSCSPYGFSTLVPLSVNERACERKRQKEIDREGTI